MPALSGPVAACALLLALGGATKVLRPADTVRALRALGLPVTSIAVRLLALFEVAVGLAVVVAGGWRPALMMAASYLGFSGVVILAMVRAGPLSSCGCFGKPDTAPTITHLLVTIAAFAVAAAAVGHPVGPLVDQWGRQPLLGLPFVVLTGCCVWFAYAALAVLPATAPFVRRRRP